jgi:hypothetical protein
VERHKFAAALCCLATELASSRLSSFWSGFAQTEGLSRHLEI